MGHKEDLDALENDINRLKTAYDLYFQGLEKRPPDKLRQDVERATRGYIGFQSPNTGYKFRAQNLVQRVATYRQLWDRILRQIEEGTYRRDIFRAKLHEKYREPGTGPAREEILEEAELYEEPSSAPKWGSVFEQYVAARKETKEAVSGLTYDKLHGVLEKQAEQIRQKYKAKDVEFKVVIEDGKARLKATPKR